MSREQIAEVLKGYRINRGLSVQQVCSWLLEKGHDIKPKTIYSYESGHRQPDADVLMMLCELYEVENILHAFGYGKPLRVEESVDIQYGELLKDIMNICFQLNVDGQKKVFEYASDLVLSSKYIASETVQVETDTDDNQYLFDNAKIMMENAKANTQVPEQEKAAK